MHHKKQSKLNHTCSGITGNYLVAAELSSRGYIAMPTLRNTRGVDILAANSDGTKTVSIQVKTKQGGEREWVLSESAEKLKSDSLFYVFVSLNGECSTATFHIVRSADVAAFARSNHQNWLSGRKKDGSERKDTSMRNFRDLDNEHKDQWKLLGLD